MKKPMTIMSISLLVIFGGLLAFNVIKQLAIKYFFAHFHPPAITVSAVTAKKTDWIPYLSTVGNFIATNGVDVNTQSGGKVSAIHFESGEYVDKDKPLIDIDDTVEQATLKYNQADLALQQTNYKRQVDLYKKNATALSSVDDAKARLLEAEANLEKTQAQINLKHIKAPFSGVLGIRLINLGQYIQPGQTGIVTLQSLDPIYLHFYIPEQYIDQIKINQSIQFTVEQNPDVLFQGNITAINSKIDANTHNVQIQATIANCPAINTSDIQSSPLIQSKKLPSGKFAIQCDTTANQAHDIKQFNFIPGMFAAIDVIQPSIHDVVVLPTTAISYTMYGDSVFVIEKNKEVMTVKRAFITTGETHNNETVIKSGVKPGQLVVSAGELKLQDGTEVVIDQTNRLVNHDNIDALGE